MPARPRFRWQIWARLAVVVATIVGMILLIERIDLHLLGTTLGRARRWPLVLGALISMIILGCKSYAWRILLAPRYNLPRWQLFRVTVLTFAVSAVIPLRGGEVLRVLLLQRDHAVAPMHSAAVAVIEKLLDIVMLLVIAVPVAVLLPELPMSFRWAVIALGGMSLVVLVALAKLAARAANPAAPVGKPGLIKRMLTQASNFFSGADALRDMRRTTAAACIIGIGWLLDGGVIALVMHAVAMPLSVATVLVAMIGLNIAIALPSTPGQIGALQLGAVAALSFAGVAAPTALAFATLYQLILLAPLLLAGLALDANVMLGKWPLP
jgi:glycosyltransferase 2 family protein